MKCPKCGYTNDDSAKKCARCGVLFGPGGRPSTGSEAPREGMSMYTRIARGVMWAVFVLVTIAVLGVGIYRGFYWIQSWWTNRLYESGHLRAPDVNVVTMDDGRLAHSITFYGKDGDSIFIKEMRRSYVITGGIVRIEIPDSSWFDLRPEDVDAVNVTFSPVLTTSNNEKKPLPALSFTVETPYSPLKLINPTEPNITVNTSLYYLQLQVVPGSEVIVGGKNQTDIVDTDGLLSVNINVYAQGDNVVSVLVRTPYHKETRQDVVIYRPVQEIALEYDVNTQTKSTRSTMTISGKIEKGASLSVDTPHEGDSIKVTENGTFSFTAKFEKIGQNIVTFRAKMEGKKDSVVSITVDYLPTLAEYSRKAWKMDYAQLVQMREQWEGRIFLCRGEVIDVIPGETQIVIMDVGSDGQRQLVALENMSSVGTPDIGRSYDAYADVFGQYFYNNQNLPKLVARYMSSTAER